MLTRLYAFLFLLFLVFLATPLTASAQAGTANGRYKFIMEDGFTRYLEFDARTDERGNTLGYFLLNDEAKITFEDVDGTGEQPRDEPVEFSFKAELDTMKIEKNRAIISGVVRDSSYRSYVGKWVQLVIEDNDGLEVPDKFVWSVCTPETGGWIPVDAENPNDQGAFMSWWVTDAERKDDVGYPSPSIIPGGQKGCTVQPLRSYEWASLVKGDGVITIRQ